MSLDRSFTPELVTALGSVRSAQFVRINTQANQSLGSKARRAWDLHGSSINLHEAAQLIATAPELLDWLEVAESQSVVTDTIGAVSPLDRIVSLGEASELVLRTVDSFNDVKAPNTGEQTNDLFVWHLNSSKHRDDKHRLFVALDIKAVRDATGALQRHVEATLYLTEKTHLTSNRVAADLRPEIRGLVAKSAILGRLGGVEFSEKANYDTLSGELARALLSTVSP